jgi:hypothetical protein
MLGVGAAAESSGPAELVDELLLQAERREKDSTKQMNLVVMTHSTSFGSQLNKLQAKSQSRK